MAATPKPVRKRHKEASLKNKAGLKKHLSPAAAKSTMKEHKKTVKQSKAKFKALGGKY
jgi:hypothetical protein